MKSFFAVAHKDIQVELRTRYSISVALLFTLITATILNFSIPTRFINETVYTGMLWTVMFFASMTGMSRSFVSEEEKGTTLLLRVISSPISVFYGKFVFNVIFSLLINFASVVFFMIFFDQITFKYYGIFLLVIFTASLGVATSSTIIGAIISRATTKGALFPILSVPILIPLITIGIEATYYSIIGKECQTILRDIVLMFGFTGLLLSLSSLVFDYVWRE
ncbi:MAG: heme exporter protein CcmB [Candidatus Kapaibacteriales bacterium]